MVYLSRTVRSAEGDRPPPLKSTRGNSRLFAEARVVVVDISRISRYIDHSVAEEPSDLRPGGRNSLDCPPVAGVYFMTPSNGGLRRTSERWCPMPSSTSAVVSRLAA